jgi:hypothetical protein
MPSIDPTEVPLFSSSVCVFVAQAHFLLPPPPLSRCRSPSPLTRRAQGMNWRIYHVPKNHLPPDANIVRDRVHPALLEHIFCGWVDPHMVWSSPRLMFLSHAVGGSEVEPLQPCQYSLCEVPCLASIKEDQLHNRLTIPIQNLIKEIHCIFELPNPMTDFNITLHEDNLSAITMAELLKFTLRTKHIAIKYHHFRSQVNRKYMV